VTIPSIYEGKVLQAGENLRLSMSFDAARFDKNKVEFLTLLLKSPLVGGSGDLKIRIPKYFIDEEELYVSSSDVEVVAEGG